MSGDKWSLYDCASHYSSSVFTAATSIAALTSMANLYLMKQLTNHTMDSSSMVAIAYCLAWVANLSLMAMSRSRRTDFLFPSTVAIVSLLAPSLIHTVAILIELQLVEPGSTQIYYSGIFFGFLTYTYIPGELLIVVMLLKSVPCKFSGLENS